MILGYKSQTDIKTVQLRLFTCSTWWAVMYVHVSKHKAMSDLTFADCFVPFKWKKECINIIICSVYKFLFINEKCKLITTKILPSVAWQKQFSCSSDLWELF